MSTKNSKGIFLDVDSSIIERSLSFATDPNQAEFNKIFAAAENQCPSKVVKPSPGFCVKTREIGVETKFFVNICTTDSIPAPKDISESELVEILESDDPSDFRVPMSIGEIRTETDKQGEETRVCDIAIHPSFFRKIEDVQLFKNFFMTIVFEGLKDKHGIVCVDDKIVLKNRKAFGTLQMHRIQQREISEKMGKERVSLIEEISGKNDNSKPIIETISSVDTEFRVPEYRLFRRKKEPNFLIGEFKFPDILTTNDLTLDVGEDRIVIESSSRHYLLDIFLPHIIRQNSCSSTFNKASKILTVSMPLVGG